VSESLKDHVAVVTGASSGIGRAIALALATQGASLCLIGRRSDRLTAVAGQAAGHAARVATYVADLRSEKELQEVVEGLRRDHGGIDILVHSAGIFARGAIGETPVEELDAQYQTNLRAPYVLTGRMLPLFRANRGQIVFVNSTAGLTIAGGVAAYASMKHALRAVADALRDEVNARGIRVLSVFIGRSATPMQEQLHYLEGRTYRPERLLQPGDVASIVLHALSLPRTAEVTDITIRPLAKLAESRDPPPK
jgi:NADP-dependent 3-hydroxy acid dehydrogenase YdfG